MDFVNLSNVGQLKMTATNPNHIGSSRLDMVSNTDMIDTAVRPETMSFEQTLLRAFDSVNEKQKASSAMVEKLITDPESVNVHDVTNAMAKASLSLSMTQTILDRVVKGWNEITTTR